ncbi:cytochrome P450 [Rhodobacterales bacterium HKCCE4037]|nr:cytochrome P450 [Rhodobacterales bacterium HKCCE4037]
MAFTTDLPPRVELSNGVAGVISLFRKASRDPSTAIPVEQLSRPILSGRRIWRWHSVSGPEEVAHVLSGNAANYPRSKVIHSVMGQEMRHSLFVAGDATHRWQRRAILERYSLRKCLSHVPMFRSLIAQETRDLPSGKSLRFNVADIIENVTLRASLKTVCQSYDPPDLRPLRRALDAFSDGTLRVSRSDVFKLPLILSARLKQGEAGWLAALKRDLSAEIDCRAKPGAAPQDDVLQTLLAARNPADGQPMPKRQILSNLMMMIVAGHEPPASAISWAIYLLATHPHVQKKARSEAEALRGQPVKGSLAMMPYLTAVLEETMRLYPVVPILLRDTLEADKIRGCPVAAGSFMIVPVYAMHRSPLFWYEPDRFIPERFLQDRAPRNAFLPFSTGSRSCIGKTFAMVEMQIVLAEFLLRFRFSATPDRVPVPRTVMSLRPKGGVWLDAERL